MSTVLRGQTQHINKLNEKNPPTMVFKRKDEVFTTLFPAVIAVLINSLENKD